MYQKKIDVTRKQRVEGGRKQENGGWRKGFRTDPHAREGQVVIWDRPKIFVLRVIEKWSIYGVDIVGVESLGRLLGRTLRLAVVIVLSRKVVPLSQGLRRCGNDTKMRSWDDT